MFGLFQPECPVDQAAKRWIEVRLQWLARQFGLGVFTDNAVVLPTREFFPFAVRGNEESVRNLLNKVCVYMNADSTLIDLELFQNQSALWLVNEGGNYLPTGAAGTFHQQHGRTVIRVEATELENLSDLVGTIAHELAHLRLMGENRMTGREFDNELVTDFTVVFHCLCIFVGNSPRNWDSQYTTWPGSDLRCPEYMTLPMFGYALAHAAWHRREQKPAWAKFLSYELRGCFKQGLRYLEKTGDSDFRPSEL